MAQQNLQEQITDILNKTTTGSEAVAGQSTPTPAAAPAPQPTPDQGSNSELWARFAAFGAAVLTSPSADVGAALREGFKALGAYAQITQEKKQQAFEQDVEQQKVDIARRREETQAGAEEETSRANRAREAQKSQELRLNAAINSKRLRLREAEGKTAGRQSGNATDRLILNYMLAIDKGYDARLNAASVGLGPPVTQTRQDARNEGLDYIRKNLPFAAKRLGAIEAPTRAFTPGEEEKEDAASGVRLNIKEFLPAVGGPLGGRELTAAEKAQQELARLPKQGAPQAGTALGGKVVSDVEIQQKRAGLQAVIDSGGAAPIVAGGPPTAAAAERDVPVVPIVESTADYDAVAPGASYHVRKADGTLELGADGQPQLYTKGGAKLQ